MKKEMYYEGELIFISHASKDKKFVWELSCAIRQQGYNPWTHDMSIPFGHPDWQNEIFQAIQQANSFVFVLSADSLKSQWCLREIERAREIKKRVLVVNYGQLKISSLLKPSELKQDAWNWLMKANFIGCDDQNKEATFKELLKEVVKESLKETKTDYEEKRAVNSARWDWQLVVALIAAIGSLLAGIGAMIPVLKPSPAPSPTQNAPSPTQTRQP
jgi:TIR domain